MSDIPFSTDQLNLREHMARIDRTIAENGKLNAETAKLNEETRKFVAEAHKLWAEERKLNRDHGLAPWVVTVGITGGILGIASFAARALGLLP